MLKVVIAGSIAILLFDAVGSLASRRWEFPYSRLMVGSFLVYLLTGFFVAAISHDEHDWIHAGIVVGLVESTLGWAISWWIGSGRRDIGDGSSAVVQVTLTIVAVVAIYGVFGLAGAATGRRWMGHRSVHAGQ